MATSKHIALDDCDVDDVVGIELDTAQLKDAAAAASRRADAAAAADSAAAAAALYSAPGNPGAKSATTKPAPAPTAKNSPVIRGRQQRAADSSERGGCAALAHIPIAARMTHAEIMASSDAESEPEPEPSGDSEDESDDDGSHGTASTGFTGTGAQRRALKVGPFVLQTGDRRCFGSATMAEHLDRAASLLAQGNEVNERINGMAPHRLCLDIDGDKSTLGRLPTAEEVDAIRAAFAEVCAERVGVPAIVEAGYEIASRKSVHLVATALRVATYRDGKALAGEVASRVARRGFVDAAKLVDCLGGKTFGLRLPCCPKAWDKSRTLVPTRGESWREFLLQVEGDTSPIIAMNHTALELPGGVASPAHAAEFLARVAKELPHFSAAPAPDGGYSFTRLAPAMCSSCKRSHDRAGAYSRLSGRAIYLNCRRAVKGSPPLLVVFSPEPEEMPAPDGFDSLGGKEVRATSEQFNNEAFADVIQTPRDIYIRAPWKTGKTELAGDIIAATLKQKAGARVLVICPRKRLADSLGARFGAKDYRALPGAYTPDVAKRFPVVVFQLESLKRIASEVVFDLVIVDEPAADIAHCFQPNAGTMTRAGLSKARALIRDAGAVFVSDNDLSAEHVAAFQLLRSPDANRAAHILRNDFRSWDGVPVYLFHGKNSPAVVRAQLFAYLDEQKAARDAGAEWFGALVPCHSRALADGLAIEIRKRYGEGAAEVLLVTAETDEKAKAEAFADINTRVAELAAMVHTPTLSVGVDITNKHMRRSFAFFTGKNAGTGQSLQMIFRGRSLESASISYDAAPVYGLPQTPRALYAWATLAENRGAIPDAFRGDLCPTIDTPTERDPVALAELVGKTFEGRAWVSDTMERFRSARWFVPRLVRSLEAAGCVVAVTEVKKAVDAAAVLGTPVDEIKANKEAAKEARGVAKEGRAYAAAEAYPAALADAVAAFHAGAAEDAAHDSKALTAAQIQGRRAFYAVDAYARVGAIDPKELHALDPDEFAGWIKEHAEPRNLEPFRALCGIVHDNAAGPQTIATGADTRTQVAVTSAREAGELVKKAFAVVGLSGALLHDDAGYVPAAAFEEGSPNFPELLAVATEINKHALRLFGDTHAGRRRKQLAEGVTPKKLRGTIAAALAHVGAEFEPEYRNEYDKKKQQNAEAFQLVWKVEQLPQPHPAHPGTCERPGRAWVAA